MKVNKVKAVKEWKTSTKIKEVESFLGFANFYRQFIKNFSHTAKPLNKLKGKKEWKWEKEQQEAFEELKEKITSQPVLVLPKREEKFQVETDVSGHACQDRRKWTSFILFFFLIFIFFLIYFHFSIF